MDSHFHGNDRRGYGNDRRDGMGMRQEIDGFDESNPYNSPSP